MENFITIIGVGALGSHVVLFARNLEEEIRIVDFDRIETKNTKAQFHTKMGLGKNKSLSMRQTIQGLFGIQIDSIPHKLTLLNVSTILSSSKIIVDCTDNAEVRNIIQKYSRENNIPCLHGAVSASGDFGRIIWDENFIIDSEDQVGQATCEDGKQLPIFGLIGAQIVVTIQKFLTDGVKWNFQIMPSGIMRI